MEQSLSPAGSLIKPLSSAFDSAVIDSSELEQNELAFQQLADFVPQLMWIANADGWIYWYNRQWYVYTGATPAQIEGWGWQSVHDPQKLPEVMKRWQSCIGLGQPFEMVFPLKGADGQFREFLTRIVPVRDQKGKLIRWFGTNTDVTDQVKMEMALKQEAEKQDALIATQQAVVQANADEDAIFDAVVQGCLSISPQAEGAVIETVDNGELLYRATSGVVTSFLGLRLQLSGSLSGLCITQGQPLVCDDTETDERVDRVATRRVGVRSMIVLPISRLGHSTGVLKLMSTKPCAFTERDVLVGQLLVGTIVTGCSTLAEAQAITALKESELKFRRLIESNIISVVFWDINGDILDANDAFLQMLGYSRDELEAGKINWRDITPPEWTERDDKAVREIVETGQTQPYEKQYRSKDGRLIDVIIGGTAFKESNNTRGVTFVVDISHRRQMEQALRESEERLSSIYNQTSVGISVRDLEGRLILANQRYAEIVGRSLEELKHLSIRDITYPDDWEKAHPLMQQVVHDGKHIVLDKRYIRSDNTTIWVRNSMSALKGEDGKPNAILAVTHDITENKRAETILRESEAHYRFISNSTPVMLRITDKDHQCTYLNQTWLDYTGQTLEEVKSTGWLNKVHPDDRQKAGETFFNAANQHITFIIEYRLQRKDGEYRWAIDSGAPLIDQDGVFQGYTGYVIDITDKQLAEHALRDSEQRLSSIFNQTSVGISVTNTEGDFISANHRYCEIVGRPLDELFHLRIQDITHSEDLARSGLLFKQSVNTGAAFTLEKRYVRPDLSYIWVRDSVSALKNENGEVTAILAVTQDITEHKYAEDALKKSQEDLQLLNEQLEYRVVERTAQLQALNKELEAFSYSVSHDLRAPLRSINGFSQMLLDAYRDRLDERGQDYLNRVRNSTQQMSRLIDAMLQLSQLTRAEIKKQPVNLSQLVQVYADDLKRQEPSREVTFIIQPDVVASVDKQLIQPVLENLVGNAWKYTSRHETARIEFGTCLHQGQTAYFVRDDGAGFDMKYAGKLFGAFQRLHGVSEFSGTGVGLATVARIIRRHGGNVWAEGELEKGATFYFTLQPGRPIADDLPNPTSAVLT